MAKKPPPAINQAVIDALPELPEGWWIRVTFDERKPKTPMKVELLEMYSPPYRKMSITRAFDHTIASPMAIAEMVEELLARAANYRQVIGEYGGEAK